VRCFCAHAQEDDDDADEDAMKHAFKSSRRGKGRSSCSREGHRGESKREPSAERAQKEDARRTQGNGSSRSGSGSKPPAGGQGSKGLPAVVDARPAMAGEPVVLDEEAATRRTEGQRSKPLPSAGRKGHAKHSKDKTDDATVILAD